MDKNKVNAQAQEGVEENADTTNPMCEACGGRRYFKATDPSTGKLHVEECPTCNNGGEQCRKRKTN